MKRRDFLKKAGTGAAGVAALGACGSEGGAAAGQTGGIDGPRVDWRLATSFPPSLDLLHGAGVRVARRVEELSGGNFTIRVYAAGEIVPALQVMDAVMQGTVQCGVSPGYYYIGKNPALAFDTAIPFGLTTRQQYAWMTHGGGLDLINAIYADFGIISFVANSTGGQMGGWFREPVNSLSELAGLRFRIPGIGGEIMSRLGVTVQNLGAPEIYPALERGAIDATEWVGPYDDEKLGFYQVAKNYYYPGWWEPGVTMGLLINLEAYNELPTVYQHILQAVAGETFADRLAAYDHANPLALQRLVRDHGVIVREYSPDIMDAAWRESNAFLEEQSAADATFRRVHESYKAFRETQWSYARGNELAYQNSALSRT
ncbi:MAG: ABC transporter substrate-binding protein [Gemmatimonadetes bacterium]|nr:ABC transporter substrate-binding protein [Gemmatimonadota bacterium]MDA1104135.1 ABC transporter substrate-binding protein [Gemmatimonadota bacterium]